MPDAVPVSASEAHEALMQMAGRRTLPVPADMIVRHALSLPGEWDWPVRRAALEALLRRFASARTQEIAVVDGPGRSPWGRYRLGRAEAEGTLPYDVRLFSVEGADDPGDGAAFEESGQGAPAVVGPAALDAALPGDSPPSRSLSMEVAGADIGQLLAALTVERLASGRLRIEAPPPAARALMSLFEGMARLMATAAEPTAPSAHGNGAGAVAPGA
jgi:hypothetical protein